MGGGGGGGGGGEEALIHTTHFLTRSCLYKRERTSK